MYEILFDTDTPLLPKLATEASVCRPDLWKLCGNFLIRNTNIKQDFVIGCLRVATSDGAFEMHLTVVETLQINL